MRGNAGQRERQRPQARTIRSAASGSRTTRRLPMRLVRNRIASSVVSGCSRSVSAPSLKILGSSTEPVTIAAQPLGGHNPHLLGGGHVVQDDQRPSTTEGVQVQLAPPVQVAEDLRRWDAEGQQPVIEASAGETGSLLSREMNGWSSGYSVRAR